MKNGSDSKRASTPSGDTSSRRSFRGCTFLPDDILLGGQWQAARSVPVQRLNKRVTVANIVGVVTGAFEDVIDAFFYGRMMRHRLASGAIFSVRRCTGQQLGAARSRTMQKRRQTWDASLLPRFKLSDGSQISQLPRQSNDHPSSHAAIPGNISHSDHLHSARQPSQTGSTPITSLAAPLVMAFALTERLTLISWKLKE